MDSSNFFNILNNEILIIAFVTWMVAQLAKPFTNYLITRKWHWGMFISTGGMPSSHSTLVTSVAVATGLIVGWSTPEFAIAATLAIVVIYDAAGVRRQAGFHAEAINVIVQELLQGHPLSDKEFREMLGHTPIEVIGGVIWATIATVTLWFLWH